MNEAIGMPATRCEFVRHLGKEMAWATAKHMGIHGLYPGQLRRSWIMLEHRAVRLSGLGAAFEGTRIAQLSDVHVSPLVRESYLRRCFEMVNDLEPDFVVLTGDYITPSARDYVRRAAESLKMLRPKVASLACLGNHDYGMWHPRMHKPVRGLGEYMAQQLDRVGITPLVNDARTFRRGEAELSFLGLGDLWCDYAPERAFERAPSASAKLALCHNPDAAYDLASFGADYICAGHTHGRSMSNTPLHKLLFPSLHRRLVVGEYPLGSGSHINVNRGLGHSRRHSRKHRPEITLLTLQSAQ